MTPNDILSEFLSIQEIADYLGLEYKTIYRLVRRGEIAAAKIGGSYRIRREALEAYIESKTTRPAGMPSGGAVVSWECSSCSRTFHGDSSKRGRCEVCGALICQSCWTVDGVRTCEAHRTAGEPEERDAPAPLSAREPGNPAETSGVVEEPAKETEAAPSQALAAAQAELEAGRIDTLVTAEEARYRIENYVNRFEAKLMALERLRDPTSDEWVRTALTGLDRRLVLFDNGLLPRSRNDDLPRPVQVIGSLKGAGGLVGANRKKVSLLLHVFVRQDRFANEGLDTAGADEGEMQRLLSELTPSRSDRGFLILGLASITGWTPEAVARAVGTDETPAFFHSDAAVVLVDLESRDLHYSAPDDRLAPFLGLFRGTTEFESLAKAERFATETLGSRNSVSADEVSRALGLEESVVIRAFRRLAGKQGFQLNRIQGHGWVLSDIP